LIPSETLGHVLLLLVCIEALIDFDGHTRP
jgi:hypothetical protein